MYHNTAQGLASLGRGNDSMLVHMTPREVGGLQQLAMAHGGSLTTNPKTGLPEAGFLESILPMLAAGATTAMGFGPVGGAIAGGLTGALTNRQNPLMGALMGGVGGYGIGGLGAGLEAFGGQQLAAEQAAQQAAILQNLPVESAVGDLSTQMFPEAINYYGASEFPGAVSPTPSPSSAMYRGLQSLLPGADNVGQNWSDFVGKAASKGVPASGLGGATGALTKAGMAAAPLIPYAMSSLGQQPTLRPGTPSGSKGNIRPYEYDPRTQTFTAMPVYAAAAGGLTPPMQDTYPQARIGRPMGTGGVAGIQEYAAGGKLLEGPGDGMSDSIPAVIKGPKPQRAALAQGEFVIPADVVSHLGNGSTDAGAKRLYAMMDKVRHARTGNKQQGKQINPEKYMPA